MDDLEFLHTKDPLFFNKPPTDLLKYHLEGVNIEICCRRIVESDRPARNDTENVLAPYEDNESKCFYL